MTITVKNVNVDDNFSIKEFSSGSLDGGGTFDIMMKAVNEHIHKEYKSQRIRGTDYANVYVQTLGHVLNQASGYALNRAKLGVELEHIEAQNLKLAADTVLATKQGALVDAQVIKEMLESEKLYLEIEHKLPRELLLMDAQLENLEADTQLKQKQVSIAEKELALKEIQIQLSEKELTLKDKQLELTDKELSIKEQQLALAKYELEVKAPVEVKSLEAQAALYAQKVITEQAQTDNSVVGEGSVIDRNNKVLEEQANSYVKDSQIKVANMLIGTWNVRRNDDPDEAPVNDINKLNDKVIGEVVSKVLGLI